MRFIIIITLIGVIRTPATAANNFYGTIVESLVSSVSERSVPFTDLIIQTENATNYNNVFH
ncbi:hypothetical protein A8P48_16310 [Yersinia pestis]|nr:hypothetical protein AU254_12995 [Yersinia pestis]PCN64860.1 hypothetical protein A8P48_16310 [Yersinia pestis]PCN66201.1 hypothetical protein A8V49_15370 [Yersinia pestis]PVU28925.1 hypothetical protein A8M58_16425 [Yersinia pestis]